MDRDRGLESGVEHVVERQPVVGRTVGRASDVKQAAEQQPDVGRVVEQQPNAKQIVEQRAVVGKTAGRKTDSKRNGASLEGLRQRKKTKARLGVERAALELVIERGFDNVTVEDICARAEISKKTFFNYFSSKAAAIMGRVDPFPDDERLFCILEEHSAACYIDVLVGIVGVAYASSVDGAILDLRREALRSMPQLFFQGQRDLLAVQRSIAAALRTYLVEHPERRMLLDQPVEEEALVASSTAIGLARTRSMLHVCGGLEPSAADTRRLIASYLSAGDAVAK